MKLLDRILLAFLMLSVAEIFLSAVVGIFFGPINGLLALASGVVIFVVTSTMILQE
jgi:hypothetical protein